MKTIRQIADTLGETKQRVYRYVVRYDIPASKQVGKTWMYDDDVAQKIIDGIQQANQLIQSAAESPSSQTTSAKYHETFDGKTLHRFDSNQMQDESNRYDSGELHQIYDESSQASTDALLQQLTRSLDALTAQLSEKDHQIQELNSRLEEAHELLSQQQTLHAMTASSSSQPTIDGEIQDVPDDSEASAPQVTQEDQPDQSEPASQEENMNTNKVSFWKRLFGGTS